jgi:hypothetical protein
MSPRFTLDLARPGRAQRSRWEWFVGPDGVRHLSIVGIGGVLLVLLVGVGGVLPRYWRYASEMQSIARLRLDVAAADKELSTLQASLREVEAGARRQVRWSQILPALSRALPGTLRIDRITLGKGARPLGGSAAAASRPVDKAADGKATELLLQIDASTQMVPGGARLVDIANFMAAVAKDPAVAPRFQLKTWEVQAPRDQNSAEQLRLSIAFAEKRS